MGKLIVIEGPDGSGKTTQLGLVCRELTERGVPFRKLEFPRYGDDSSMLVRMYLEGRFGSKPDDVNAFAASSFYAADRYASYKTDWGAGYESGILHISGRYTTSNAIHQGAKLKGRERLEYMDWLFDYEYRLLGLPEPDIVIFLDIDAELLQMNIEKRNENRDIHETDREYMLKCLESAHTAAQRYKWRTVRCGENNKMRPKNEILKEIMGIITNV